MRKVLLDLGVGGLSASVSSVFLSRLLCFLRRRRLVKARSLLVWLDEEGVAGSWLLVGCLGGGAATAARVGRRIFLGSLGVV